MNGGFQVDDIGDLIKLFLVLAIMIPFIGAMFSLIGSLNQQCPQCDCSVYENSLKNCTDLVSNLTKQLNESPVQYINNITYVEVPVEKIVYKERFVPITLNILAFIFSVGVTFSLFRIRIKLSKELEEKFEGIERAIRFVKLSSLFVSIILFFRLLYIAVSLF